MPTGQAPEEARATLRRCSTDLPARVRPSGVPFSSCRRHPHSTSA